MVEKQITRRDFIKKVGKGTAAAGVAAMMPRLVKPARAADKDYILIGHPNPSTGPLGSFGEASPWADDKAIAAINSAGGIYIKEYGKKVPIKLKMADTESNPTKAAELAGKLILKDKVDMMVVMHTPDTVNPVGAICERYKMPCVSLDAPVDAWLTGGPYKYTFHAFWTVDTISDLYIGIWDMHKEKTSKVVGGIWPNDPDGVSWAPVFTKKLQERGYKVVDPGRFPYDVKDFSSFITMFKKNNVDIITGVIPPPDFTTFWRQCHTQGFIPKMATFGKGILFPADVAAHGGDLPLGLTTELWWSPYAPFKSSLTGESAQQLCDTWTKETKRQWTAPIGFKYAGFEIAADALKRAQTLDKEKIRDAIAATNMDTIVGHIQYNKDNFAETPLVGSQWQKGSDWPWAQQVIYNKSFPAIKKTAKMIFPLPG